MRRTLVGFPDQDLLMLDTISARHQVSRAELIRLAVSSYIEKFKAVDEADDAFGIWKVKKIDGLAYQAKLREEW
jgi:metal-responsive CopG/Arc/MetJ family transcriptional regulator